MARVHSFKPIEDRNAEILILGSMPGRKSLDEGQYYAHQHNPFWRIMAELLQFDTASSYESRAKALKSARIALWDVLKSCTRKGSLDSMIESGSQTANDFRTFFRRHGKIRRVYFNGAKAEACYKRHVLGKIDSGPISYSRLPSTSPANASLSYARKLAAWRAILRPGQPVRTSDRSRDRVAIWIVEALPPRFVPYVRRARGAVDR